MKNPILLQLDENTKIPIEDVTELASSIQKLETEILNIKIKSIVSGDAHPGGYIFELLEKTGVRRN